MFTGACVAGAGKGREVCGLEFGVAESEFRSIHHFSAVQGPRMSRLPRVRQHSGCECCASLLHSRAVMKSALEARKKGLGKREAGRRKAREVNRKGL